jgi:L-arabinose isomerase
MVNIPYEARVVILGMESLETRRLKLDMQFAYKILFGTIDRDYSTMFGLNAAQRTRSHNYKLYVQRSQLESRKHFFSNRIVKS